MKKRNLSFAILFILALLALVALIWVLAPVAAPETPPVLLSVPPVAEGTDTAAVPGTPDRQILTVDTETVRTAIATLSRAGAYARTLTVQSFWNGGSASSEIDVWVRDGATRLRIRESGRAAEKHVLLRDGEKWIWYSDSAEVWHGPAAEGDADAYQTLLTYEDVLDLDPSAVTDAGYTSYNGEDCIFVRYTAGALGYENLCYISDASGLLMGVETYDRDALVYAMRSSAPDFTALPDESLFRSP